MLLRLSICFLIGLIPLFGRAAELAGAVEFRKDIRPILEKYCFDCHADGFNKGEVAFDEFSTDQAILEDKTLWLRALKNLRAGLMPPAKKAQPTAAERERITRWIRHSVFEIDPQNLDPGRVTIRRLNRVEYRNTIRDLLGVDYDTEGEFPADDTGYGFDNIGDVLTLPPMLLEKYLLAANAIVAEAVPTISKVVPEKKIAGCRFRSGSGEPVADAPLSLSFYEAAAVSTPVKADYAGHYQLVLALMVNEKYVDNVFDLNKCRMIFKVDGKELLRKEFSWEGGKPYSFELNQDWQAGEHQLAFELEPLTPGEPRGRTLSVQINAVTVRGPVAKEHWARPRNYEKFFPKPVPDTAQARRDYARELLGKFASQAFRHPVDDETQNRLTGLAEHIYQQPGKTFEAGVAQAMVAVLASPRFLFRAEGFAPSPLGQSYAFVDDYALASRLSYFFWSSMPDEELFQLAKKGELRTNLLAQANRMLADSRSEAFIRNFTGQWLQARDIDTVPIEARFILVREEKFDPDAARRRKRGQELRNKNPDELTKEEKEELASLFAQFRGRRQPRADLTGELRRAMRLETEKYFEFVLREDRSLLELIDSDYTFLNERLARHYGITNVYGMEMRRVVLSPDSPRGGVLTHGSVLAVTSNPTRTSPVKRGVFILDNILGMPPPPPPPNIPALEDALGEITGHQPTLRETLAVHREDAMCGSCHNRMDPIGLAFENFNAMGMWRAQEYDQPIDASGKLITGEEFGSVKELKRILVKKYSTQFYQTLTEKLLTYALGRGLEYYDVGTVDQIVEQLEKTKGQPSVLLRGVVESAAFQKTRRQETQAAAGEKSGHAKAVRETALAVHQERE